MSIAQPTNAGGKVRRDPISGRFIRVTRMEGEAQPTLAPAVSLGNSLGVNQVGQNIASSWAAIQELPNPEVRIGYVNQVKEDQQELINHGLELDPKSYDQIQKRLREEYPGTPEEYAALKKKLDEEKKEYRKNRALVVKKILEKLELDIANSKTTNPTGDKAEQEKKNSMPGVPDLAGGPNIPFHSIPAAPINAPEGGVEIIVPGQQPTVKRVYNYYDKKQLYRPVPSTLAPYGPNPYDVAIAAEAGPSDGQVQDSAAAPSGTDRLKDENSQELSTGGIHG